MFMLSNGERQKHAARADKQHHADQLESRHADLLSGS
jgi:hypothetical protein